MFSFRLAKSQSFESWLLILFLIQVVITTDPQVRELDQHAETTRKQLQRDAKNATLYVELGMILQELDYIQPNGGRRLPEAEKAYRSALELDINIHLRVLIMGNLGVILMNTDRLEEAINVFEESIKLARRHQLPFTESTGTMFNLAKVFDALGATKKAEVVYLDVLKIARGIDSTNFAKAFASLKSFSPELASEILCMADVFVNKIEINPSRDCNYTFLHWWKDFSLDDQSWTCFAAFHVLINATDQASIDRSWIYLTKANQIQDLHSGYTSSSETLRALKSSFPASIFEIGSGLHSRIPIFIVGMARSGSTLIEQALASHSRIHALGEDTPFAPLVDDLITHLSESGLVGLEKFGQAYLDAVKERLPSSKKQVFRTVDKMLNNMLNIGFIQLVFPESCLIYITRHPLDCGLSCFMQPFEGRGTPWAWNLTSIGEKYQLMNHLYDHWSRVLPGRILRVHYENVVMNFETEMRKILKHCDLSWEDSVLEFHQTQRPIHTSSYAQVRKKLYKTSIGRWKKYNKHLRPLKDALGDSVSRYEKEIASTLSLKDEL